MSPIPVGLCGKILDHVGNFVEMMAPEYEVAHVFQSTSAASSELPALLRGEQVKPKSGLGTNAQSAETKVPRVMIVGGGFTSEELAEMRALPGASEVPWMHNDPSMLVGMPSPMTDPRGFMKNIVKRVKPALENHGLAEGKGKGELWRY